MADEVVVNLLVTARIRKVKSTTSGKPLVEAEVEIAGDTGIGGPVHKLYSANNAGEALSWAVSYGLDRVRIPEPQ